MAGAQNAFCVGAEAAGLGSESQPHGFALAWRLVESLQENGFAFSEARRLRTDGWHSQCQFEDVLMQLRVSTSDGERWFIAFESKPSEILPRVVKRATLARGRALSYEVAMAAHVVLANLFQSVRWAVDGDPSKQPNHDKPVFPD